MRFGLQHTWLVATRPQQSLVLVHFLAWRCHAAAETCCDGARDSAHAAGHGPIAWPIPVAVAIGCGAQGSSKSPDDGRYSAVVLVVAVVVVGNAGRNGWEIAQQSDHVVDFEIVLILEDWSAYWRLEPVVLAPKTEIETHSRQCEGQLAVVANIFSGQAARCLVLQHEHRKAESQRRCTDATEPLRAHILE
jgi:hypothetical protein